MSRATENLLLNSWFRSGMESAECGHSIDMAVSDHRPGLAREYAAAGWRYSNGQYAPCWPIDCKPSVAWRD